MNETTTTDLAKFGNREKAMAADLLTAYSSGLLPDDFIDDQVTVMLNMNSGNVFLTNSEYQVAMFNGDVLESFYSCPECGCEGFTDDLITDFKNNNANQCCMDYLKELGKDVPAEVA